MSSSVESFDGGRNAPRPRRLRARLFAASALLSLVAFSNTEAAPDERALKLVNAHTGERATIVFKRNGSFVPEGLKQLNHIFRDWRVEREIAMDPKLFDVLWEAYQESGGREAINIICGYRSPDTNEYLRKRTSGVAENSQHINGKAIDFFIPDVPLAKLREIGLRLQEGGVGFYPTSGSPFVHLDTGSVRHWPSMTHDQLAKVFPAGHTLHIPSDGKPLPGYGEALAEYKARGTVTNVAVATRAAPEDLNAAKTSAASANQKPVALAANVPVPKAAPLRTGRLPSERNQTAPPQPPVSAETTAAIAAPADRLPVLSFAAAGDSSGTKFDPLRALAGLPGRAVPASARPIDQNATARPDALAMLTRPATGAATSALWSAEASIRQTRFARLKAPSAAGNAGLFQKPVLLYSASFARTGIAGAGAELRTDRFAAPPARPLMVIDLRLPSKADIASR